MSTTTDISSIQIRLTRIETVINLIQVAMLNLGTKESITQILILVQEDMRDMITDITQLRREVDSLNAEVFK